MSNDDVTVTLQWLREPGAVYYVSVLPQVHYTNLTNAMTIMINLAVSYDTPYNVNIASSLCGVTTIKVLKYGKVINIIIIVIKLKTESC